MNNALAKLKDYKNHPFFDQFRDMRAVGLLIFLVVVLLISWSGVKAIQTNFELQKEISELQQENQLQQLKNKNLQLQNQYFRTDQYLELQARQIFGKGRSGETELIVPKEVALANVSNVADDTTATPSRKQPFYQRNFQEWINFFLHRQGGDVTQ